MPIGILAALGFMGSKERRRSDIDIDDCKIVSLNTGWAGVRHVLKSHGIDPSIINDTRLTTKEKLITFALREANNPNLPNLRFDPNKWIQPPEVRNDPKYKYPKS